MKDLDKKIYSVSDLNLHVKSLIQNDDEIQNVWVKGEISNFTHHEGRHMYFVLKDEKSEIDCAMFRSQNKDMDFDPEEGMEVICRGDVGMYVPRGQYQLVVREMMVGGKGKLYLAYEQLKEKLSEEGLFDDVHKKNLPHLPKKIGIVTSEEAAALRDMCRGIKQRLENAKILLAPSQVQGEGSSAEIVEGIKRLDERDIDVIIVGRGGGSIEDLWSFNEEEVARAIFKAETPIVSAVGHETDFLISDFVADERAPTPTGAAELVVPKKLELEQKLKRHEERLSKTTKNLIEHSKNELDKFKSSTVFRKPLRLLEDPYQRLDENEKKLHRSLERNFKRSKQKLEGQREKLKALGPIETMERGYSIVMAEDGQIVDSVEAVSKGDLLSINMNDGDIEAETKEVEKCQKDLKK